MVPRRTPSQLGQLQFHWGKPPPAADPRTRILTKVFQGRRKQGKTSNRTSPVTDLAGCAIHRGFETKTNLGVLRLCPHKHLQQVRTEVEMVLAGEAYSENGRLFNGNAGWTLKFPHPALRGADSPQRHRGDTEGTEVQKARLAIRLKRAF